MRILFSLIALAGAAAGPACAADSGDTRTLSVAAAANLVYALEALNAEFRSEEPGLTLTSATGASGGLVAQISHGAPFDVFLSADRSYSDALIKAGQADAKTLKVFALGRLVLWTKREGISLSDVGSLVRSPLVRKLAIANADTAPYGRAAEQALKALGAWDDAAPKLVVGENISQAAQFVETGNADAGFVALSIVVSPNLKAKGRWVEVAANLYDPLEQCAVVTAHGASNPAAILYVAFLGGPAAQRILGEFGYGIPPQG